MIAQTPEPECSVCRKKNSERFYRKNSSGRRCIECGHEQITETVTATEQPATIWRTSNNTRPQF